MLLSKISTRACAAFATKAAACVVAATLFAAEASAKGFTVTATGGLNWADATNAPGVNTDTGSFVAGAVGTPIDSVPGLSVQAEVSFRHDPVTYGKLSIAHETTGVLGNLVYDLPVHVGPVQPFVLVGGGYASTEATLESVSLASVSASGLAWQLGAGANMAVADGVSVGVGYRYFVGPELEVFGYKLSDSTNHTVEAHVSFSFE